jgi:hypothetical protein
MKVVVGDRELMERLMDKPQCRLFLAPVDPVADGCADYLEVCLP